MAYKSAESQADALRLAHSIEREPSLSTLSRAAVGKDNVVLIDWEKIRVGDAAHLAAVRTLLGALAPDSPLVLNTQADDYTLVRTDAGRYVRMTKETSTDLTVPANEDVPFPIGTQIVVRNAGEGQVTIVAAEDVTINTAQTLMLRAQHSSASLVKIGEDEWDLAGDLEAP